MHQLACVAAPRPSPLALATVDPTSQLATQLEAIVKLKDRSSSSVIAIATTIENDGRNDINLVGMRRLRTIFMKGVGERKFVQVLSCLLSVIICSL